tara:strand:- start:638 stop:844 length:207 start_codon:yes stop_codon:yes gene_type:complete
MKWVIASTCIDCEEMGNISHTAIAQDKDINGNFAPFIFDSKLEAELFITEIIGEDLENAWATPQQENM